MKIAVGNVPEARLRNVLWNNQWITSKAQRTKSIKKLGDEHLLNILRLAMKGAPPFHKNFAVLMGRKMLTEVERRMIRAQTKREKNNGKHAEKTSSRKGRPQPFSRSLYLKGRHGVLPGEGRAQ